MLAIDPVESTQPKLPATAWRIGLGAGLAGALLVALKYALRPPTRRPVPDTISPASFATKVLHTSRGELVYHEAGHGRPILFVHNVGLGASSYEWARVYPAFAGDFRVFALDLIGFGESSRPELPFVGEDFVCILAEAARALGGGEPVIVVASGLSAAFCAQLAARHPELVARLILHMPDGSGHCGQHRLTRLSRFIYRAPLLGRFLYRNHLSTRAAVTHWLRKAAFAEPALVTEETIQVVATCAGQPGAEFAALRWLSGRLSVDLAAALQAITQPVALTWGGAVPAAPIALGRELQQLARATSLTIFPESGILAARESSAEMTAALKEQLRGDLRLVQKAS